MSKSLKEVREMPRFKEIQSRVVELMDELNSLLTEANELTGGDFSAGVNAAHSIFFVPRNDIGDRDS